jgi:signal transduction histidine kinase
VASHDEAVNGSGDRRLGPGGLDLVLALCVALCALAVAIALSSQTLENRYAPAVVAVLGIAVPVATGIFAWRLGIARRFGRLLVALGFAWFLTTLSNSESSLLYSLGRVSAWAVEAMVVYVLLAYPTGRLGSGAERIVAAAAALVAGLLYVPSALFVTEFPSPSPWSACTGDCPPNALFVAGQEPAFVPTLEIVREVLATGVFVAAAAILAVRLRRSTPLTRASLAPVVAVAAARLALAAAFLFLRRAGAPHEVVELGALMLALGVPLISAAFMVGLVRSRLHTARALETINGRVLARYDPAGLEALVADALGDPSLRFYVPARGRAASWEDVSGRVVDRPAPTPGRIITEIRNERGGGAALLVCDEAIRTQNGLLAAAVGCVREHLERQHLTEALQSSLREVDASRARLAAAADVEKRRIERDLHDGAQQRLISLRLRLQLAEEAYEDDPDRAFGMLHALGPQIDEVIEEVRALSRGIYPALLVDAGLASALRAVALDSPLPVGVRAVNLGRYSPEIEGAVYFCCLEAIQNAGKHANASAVSVEIVDRGKLAFEVRDDGAGFKAGGIHPGSGLTNMRDRIAAVGGELVVESTPGKGTAVSGSVPIGGGRREAPAGRARALRSPGAASSSPRSPVP